MPPEPRVESNKGRSRMTSMWDGAPLTLAQNEQAIMPQTPNGSAVLAWLNMATQNNSGTLALTTDGCTTGLYGSDQQQQLHLPIQLGHIGDLRHQPVRGEQRPDAGCAAIDLNA
jgi:hypothetical protein